MNRNEIISTIIGIIIITAFTITTLSSPQMEVDIQSLKTKGCFNLSEFDSSCVRDNYGSHINVFWRCMPADVKQEYYDSDYYDKKRVEPGWILLPTCEGGDEG